MKYERITISEDTEVDWEGPGYYELTQQNSMASGQWWRYVKTAELDAHDADGVLAQTASDLR